MTEVSGRGIIPSPNIWNAPDTYETENRAADPDGVIEAAIASLHPWQGADVLDVGCGTGFHLPRFRALGAASVIGLEPRAPLARRALDRCAGAATEGARIGVVRASAEAIPLADRTVDLVHARWAYFFGAGSEPGIVEALRVVRRGGAVCVVDNDATRSTFGTWFARAHPAYDPVAVERFWARHGFTRMPLTIRWAFASVEDLAAVLRIEFAPAGAEAILASHPGTQVDYAVNLWWRLA